MREQLKLLGYITKQHCPGLDNMTAPDCFLFLTPVL